MNETPTWLAAAIRIVVVSSWLALALGILGSATSQGPPALVAVAATLSGAFVVALTYTPRRFLTEGGLNLEFLIVAGVVLTSASLALTGRAASPYLLMALLPSLLAAITRGHRLGFTTGFLSAGLLTAVILVAEGFAGVVASAAAIALFPLLALLVGQIRRILVDIEQRANSLEAASVQTEAELERISQANHLLRRLIDLYGSDGSNPLEVARSALEATVDAYPGSHATATMFDARGPVVVARVGTDGPKLVRTQIRLGEGDTTSGVVSLGTPKKLSPAELRDLDILLRPVSVSFANTVLLQDIASAAVQEERLRLARELHDEVGPALAALGLSLDAAQMNNADEDLDSNLGQIRESLSGIVEDLRGIIADLRAQATGSLSSELRAVLRDLEPPPEVQVDLSERRPPRGMALRQILAIVIESVRNAHQHADASIVRVQGEVDRSSVSIEIEDNGAGFDSSELPEGHFGIMGMRERADRIGASLEIGSGAGGTIVSLNWKEKR